MLRNSEKFNEKVRAHIFDCLVDNDGSSKEVIQKVVDEFKNWRCQYKLLFRTKAEAFIGFLHSSPKSIRPAVKYYDPFSGFRAAAGRFLPAKTGRCT